MSKSAFSSLFLILVVLLAGCSKPDETAEEALQSSPAASAPEIIELTFNWSPHIRADISFRREKTEKSNDFSHKQVINGNYEMLTQPAPQGLLVKQHNHELEIERSNQQELGPVDQQAEDFLVRTASKSPLFVVGPDGRVLGFYNIEEFKNELLEATAEWAEEVEGPHKDRVPSVIESITAGNNIEQSLIQVWNREVALWDGQKLQVGKPYEIKGTQTFSSLDFMEVPVILTITLYGRTPCEAAGHSLECVEVEYAYSLDQSQVEEIEQAYLELEDDGRQGLSDLDLNYSLKITLEPDTLLPHKLVEEERQEYILQREGYLAQHDIREIENETRYEYTQRLDLMVDDKPTSETLELLEE